MPRRSSGLRKLARVAALPSLRFLFPFPFLFRSPSLFPQRGEEGKVIRSEENEIRRASLSFPSPPFSRGMFRGEKEEDSSSFSHLSFLVKEDRRGLWREKMCDIDFFSLFLPSPGEKKREERQ